MLSRIHKSLRHMERGGALVVWHPYMDDANRMGALRERLCTADAVCPLISPDMLDDAPVPFLTLCEDHKVRGLRVIPILAFPTALSFSLGGHKSHWLEDLAPLPSNGRPISTYRDLDEVLSEVAREIRRIASKKEQRSDPPNGNGSPKLAHDVITELHRAAIQGGLAGNKVALLSGIPPEVTSSFAIGTSNSDNMLIALNTLNEHNPDMLVKWLENALLLLGIRREARTVQGALDKLRGHVLGRP